jgi:hypothetical protein
MAGEARVATGLLPASGADTFAAGAEGDGDGDEGGLELTGCEGVEQPRKATGAKSQRRMGASPWRCARRVRALKQSSAVSVDLALKRALPRPAMAASCCA